MQRSAAFCNAAQRGVTHGTRRRSTARCNAPHRANAAQRPVVCKREGRSQCATDRVVACVPVRRYWGALAHLGKSEADVLELARKTGKIPK